MSAFLEVPDSNRFAEEFGVTPEGRADDDVQSVNFLEVTGQDLTLSYSSLERSVRLRLRQGQEELIDIYREDATLMRIDTSKGSTGITVAFSMGEVDGELRIQVFPSIKIYDQLLRR
ncbi:hypothetical protein A6A06_23930 [Streptomyces sp. CB02923]|uniref:hypothetical protein n=1 Tax=Streptomyces sp. CB02923 TaxID=1718985 RepID=UPI00093C931C|nr:hypothetical protein [Streptomyces sp. CB02923]OKI00209.1 hypothetical protein A6A06_23930 [Streptomyces sp. CB02923]